MTAAIYAEWTKLRTLTATAWLLIGAIAVTVGVSAAVAAATHQSAVIAVHAILAISEEYGTGMIHTTLAAIPRRLILLGAKATNVAALTFVAALIAVTACLIAGRLMLPASGLDPAHGYALVSIAHAATLRAAVGSVIYLTLIGLLALGAATAIRDTAVSIGAVLAVLYLPPLLAQLVGNPLRRHLEQVAPMTAGLAVQTTRNLHNLPIAPWAGLGVLAAWAATGLLAGGLLLRLRDA
jgi:ABC-2 type transport system permease protein